MPRFAQGREIVFPAKAAIVFPAKAAIVFPAKAAIVFPAKAGIQTDSLDTGVRRYDEQELRRAE